MVGNPMKRHAMIVLVLLTGLIWPAAAGVIGTNVPASSLTLERIAMLPAAQQPVWREYLARSERQQQADRNSLAGELKVLGLKKPVLPRGGHSAEDLDLNRPGAWYGSDEARRIAANVVSYQTPAGGWSKNMDMTQHPRAPGEAYAVNNNNRFSNAADFDLARDPDWHYVGTFDNDATITQMRFLAKVVTAGKTNVAADEAAFLRGLDYSLNAQYPNGGWPQVWPLEGGYHDTITINDDAMLHVLALMNDVAEGNGDYAWVPPDRRAPAKASFQRGLACLLAAQIREPGGRLTVWCQQHDALTLEPASGRNYEMPSAVSSESASVVLFLMQLPHPDSNVLASVRAAVAWFEKTKIMDKAYRRIPQHGRALVDAKGVGPLWARYYQIGTDRPIFGDRDKTIHDNVNEISLERQNGYGWYRNNPEEVLEKYPRWLQATGG